MAVELHTSSAERIAACRRVFALDAADHRRELTVQEFWPHKGRVVLKFAGVGTISEAETLVGCEIQVPREERAPLPAGQFYVSDLVGCTLFDRGLEVGRISDIQFGAGDAPLLVVKAGAMEHLVPFTEAYLRKVDLQARRIEMVLPEGMLEV